MARFMAWLARMPLKKTLIRSYQTQNNSYSLSSAKPASPSSLARESSLWWTGLASDCKKDNQSKLNIQSSQAGNFLPAHFVSVHLPKLLSEVQAATPNSSLDYLPNCQPKNSCTKCKYKALTKSQLTFHIKRAHKNSPLPPAPKPPVSFDVPRHIMFYPQPQPSLNLSCSSASCAPALTTRENGVLTRRQLIVSPAILVVKLFLWRMI